MVDIFKFTSDGQEHEIGDSYCTDCWREPVSCKDCDSGFVHSELFETGETGGILIFKCDVCNLEDN